MTAFFRIPRRSFTLVELLAVVAIVAVLAALLAVAGPRALVTARKTKAMSNLHQVGVAMLAYAGEHDGVLPGPCTYGIKPYYNWNAVPLGDLGGFIGPYLGYPDLLSIRNFTAYPTVSVLVSPGMAAWNPATLQTNSGIPHYIQNSVTNGFSAYRVLGSVTAPWVQQPLRLTQLTALVTNAGQDWILTDVDQQLNDATARATGWYTQLPPKPVYGNVRLRLYAGGQVEEMSVSTNAP